MENAGRNLQGKETYSNSASTLALATTILTFFFVMVLM